MKSSYLTLGYRNLTRRKSRTLLTLLGVVLAIGFTVGLLSVSEGFMRSFDKFMGSQGPEMYVVPPGQGHVPFPMALSCGGVNIDEDAAQYISGIPGVRVAEPLVKLFAYKRGKKSFMGDMPQFVFAVPPDTFFRLRPTAKMLKGRPLRGGDKFTMVLGGTMAKNLEVHLGDRLDADGRMFTVVGIMKKADEPFDYLGYVPLKTAQTLRESPDKVCGIMVKLDNPRKVDDVKKRIHKMFPKLGIMTVDEIVSKAKSMMTMTQAVHFAVSCFALIIGVLFVACTMIMSVSERVREFATLRVIGASRGYVRKMIISESLILSLLGGVGGCLLGFGLSKLMDWINYLTFGETFLKTYVSLKIFSIAFVIVLLIGTFAGLVPARMILKKDPAESLKYE